MTKLGKTVQIGNLSPRSSELYTRKLGYIGGALLIAFHDWHNIEVRTLTGALMMRYSTERSVDNVEFICNRFLFCDFGADGIVSYEYKIWDFVSSSWTMESKEYEEYTNEYLLFGQHPAEPIIAIGYSNDKESIDILDLNTRTITARLVDQDMAEAQQLAFNQYDKNLALLTYDRISVIQEDGSRRDAHFEADFSVWGLCWINNSHLVNGHKKGLCFWDAHTLGRVGELQTSFSPSEIVVSDNGRWLACSSCGAENQSLLIDLHQSVLHEIEAELILFAPNGNLVCYSCTRSAEVPYRRILEEVQIFSLE